MLMLNAAIRRTHAIMVKFWSTESANALPDSEEIRTISASHMFNAQLIVHTTVTPNVVHAMQVLCLNQANVFQKSVAFKIVTLRTVSATAMMDSS